MIMVMMMVMIMVMFIRRMTMTLFSEPLLPNRWGGLEETFSCSEPVVRCKENLKKKFYRQGQTSKQRKRQMGMAKANTRKRRKTSKTRKGKSLREGKREIQNYG